MVVGHPLREDRAAAAHDSGDALRDQRQILNQHSGVDGHVIDALRGLLFDNFEHDFGIQIFHALDARNCLINRNSADGHRRVTQNGFTNFVNVAAGGKIHHGIGAVVYGGVQLFQLFFNF